MIVSPAIDIREGNCVQLVGGSYEEELFRLPDPISVCKDWISKGFSNVHIIDLDRATNRGSNVEVIEKLCATNSEINFRVGGGIRSTQDVRELLDFGSKSVVVGTKAVVDPKWFREIVKNFPGQIYVAIEVDGLDVKVSGWTESAQASLEELIEEFNDLDLAGVFVTAIHKEGKRQGTDLELFANIRKLTKLPIVASGGVTTLGDIDNLESIGIEEVVLGAAIYTDPELSNALQEREQISRQSNPEQ